MVKRDVGVSVGIVVLSSVAAFVGVVAVDVFAVVVIAVVGSEFFVVSDPQCVYWREKKSISTATVCFTYPGTAVRRQSVHFLHQNQCKHTVSLCQEK